MKHQTSVDHLVQKGRDWYLDRYESIQVERNRYFVLLLICLVLLLVSLLANVILIPLKTLVPYVIEVDKTTGITTVVKSADSKSLSSDQAVTIYFLLKYLNARMNYQYDLRQQNADIVRALSTSQTYQDYVQSLDTSNPKSPIRLYRDTHVIDVRVVSYTFPYPNIAEIHFYTETKSVLAGDNTPPIRQYWLATLKYTYESTVPLSESARAQMNPLGFFITNFQLSQETPGGNKS